VPAFAGLVDSHGGDREGEEKRDATAKSTSMKVSTTGAPPPVWSRTEMTSSNPAITMWSFE